MALAVRPFGAANTMPTATTNPATTRNTRVKSGVSLEGCGGTVMSQEGDKHAPARAASTIMLELHQHRASFFLFCDRSCNEHVAVGPLA